MTKNAFKNVDMPETFSFVGFVSLVAFVMAPVGVTVQTVPVSTHVTIELGTPDLSPDNVTWRSLCCIGRTASTRKPECPDPRRVSCSAEKASLLY